MLAALEGRVPDRLPVTTHHVMPYFLKKHMGGISPQAFFDHFGFDATLWLVPAKPDESKGEYFDLHQEETEGLQVRRVWSDSWRIEPEDIPDPTYRTTRYRFVTPGGELSMVLQANEYTRWVSEPLIKEKADIDLIAQYAVSPTCDAEAANAGIERFGQRGIVKGQVCGFDVTGQPGCWADACRITGTQRMIIEAHDDPSWVHQFLRILQRRKTDHIRSMQEAKFDLLEFGGGDASTTVISPKMFHEFVAPYDGELIRLAHQVGQRIVYHTCGGMMPILEDIAAMAPDVMETFTPPGMGGDVDLREAKRRIGEEVCMMGGFDQFHFFQGCRPEDTRAAVRKCFDEAGAGGGYVLCPSDHFFDAELELIEAFVDEAKRCVY